MSEFSITNLVSKELANNRFFYELSLKANNNAGNQTSIYTMYGNNIQPTPYSNSNNGEIDATSLSSQSATNQQNTINQNNSNIQNQFNTNGNTATTIQNIKAIDNNTGELPANTDTPFSTFTNFINTFYNDSNIISNSLLFDQLETSQNQPGILFSAWWETINFPTETPSDWYLTLPVHSVLPITETITLDNVTFEEGYTLIIFDKVLNPVNKSYSYSFISTNNTNLINYANDNNNIILNILYIQYLSNFTQDYTLIQENNENNLGIESSIGTTYNKITLSDYSSLTTTFNELIYENTTNKIFPITINTLTLPITNVNNYCVVTEDDSITYYGTYNIVSYNNMQINGSNIDSRFRGWTTDFVGNFIDTSNGSFVNLILNSYLTWSENQSKCIYANFYVNTPSLQNGTTYNYVSFSNVSFNTSYYLSFQSYQYYICGQGIPCPTYPPNVDISQVLTIYPDTNLYINGNVYEPSGYFQYDTYYCYDSEGNELEVILSLQPIFGFGQLFLFVPSSSQIQLSQFTTYNFYQKITTTNINSQISYFTNSIDVNGYSLTASSSCFENNGQISLTYFEPSTTNVYELIFFTYDNNLYITNSTDSPANINAAEEYQLSELSNNPITIGNSPFIVNPINDQDWQKGTLSLGLENSLNEDNVYTIPIENIVTTNSGIICDVNNRVVQYYPNTTATNKLPYIRQNIITINNYSPIGNQLLSNPYYQSLIKNISSSNPLNLFFIDDGSYIANLASSPWIQPTNSINVQVGGISQDDTYYYYFPVGNSYIENNFSQGNGNSVTPPNANYFENNNSPSVIKYIPILKSNSAIQNLKSQFTAHTIKQFIIKSFNFIYNDNDLNINLDDDNFIGATYERGNGIYDTAYVNFKNWSFSVTSGQQLWYLLFYGIDFANMKNGDSIPLTNFGITVLDFYPASAKQVMGHPLVGNSNNYEGPSFNTNLNIVKQNISSGEYYQVPVTYTISFTAIDDPSISSLYNEYNNFEFNIYTNTPDIELPSSFENSWDNYTTSLDEKVGYYNSVRNSTNGYSHLGGFITNGYFNEYQHYKSINDLSRAIQGLIISLSGNFIFNSGSIFNQSYSSYYGITEIGQSTADIVINAPVFPKFWNSFFESMLIEMQWQIFTWTTLGTGYPTSYAFNDGVISYNNVYPNWRANTDWIYNNAMFPGISFNQQASSSFNLPFIVSGKIWNVNYSTSDASSFFTDQMVISNWWMLSNNMKNIMNGWITPTYALNPVAFGSYGSMNLCNFCWFDVCFWTIAEVVFPNFAGSCGKCQNDFLWFVNYVGWGKGGGQTDNFLNNTNENLSNVLGNYNAYMIPYIFPSQWINQGNGNYVLPAFISNQLQQNFNPTTNNNFQQYFLIEYTNNTINDTSKYIYEQIVSNNAITSSFISEILSGAKNLNNYKIDNIQLSSIIDEINKRVLSEVNSIFENIEKSVISNIYQAGYDELVSEFGSDAVSDIMGDAIADELIVTPKKICNNCNENNQIYKYYYKKFKRCADFIKRVYYGKKVCNPKLIKAEKCSISFKGIMNSENITINKLCNNLIKITLSKNDELYLYQYHNKGNKVLNSKNQVYQNQMKFLKTDGIKCKTAYTKFFINNNTYIIFFRIYNINIDENNNVIIKAKVNNIIKNNKKICKLPKSIMKGVNNTMNIDYIHTIPYWLYKPFNNT